MTSAPHLKDQALRDSKKLLIGITFSNDILTLHHVEQLATAAVNTGADTGAQGTNFP